MKNKRGAEHVEVIISFAIFIFFIIFLFLILNPFKYAKADPKINEIAIVSIEELITIDVLTTSINVDPISELCFKIDNFNSGEQVLVLDINSNRVPAKIDSEGKLVVDNGQGYYEIYYSNDFDPKDSTGSACPELSEGLGGYNIGQVKSVEFVSASKLQELYDSYDDSENSYNALKTQLHIPSSRDFGFRVEDTERVPVEGGVHMQDITKKTEVTSTEKIIRVIDSEGKIETQILRVLTW